MSKQQAKVRMSGSIPSLPLYTIGGVKQPAGFGAAAWHTLKVLGTAESAKDAAYTAGNRDWSMAVTEDLLPKLIAIADQSNEHRNGVIAVLLNSFCEWEFGGGSPNFEVWTPLQPAWEGDNSEIPPEGCLFFEVDGLPHSVDQCLSASVWHDQTHCTAVNVDVIRNQAKPITRAKFDSMRWRLGTEARERAAETPETAECD